MDTKLPHGFVFLSDIDASILESVRYYSDDNFLGRRVKGYGANKIICTHQAAVQLKEVHNHVKNHGYNLVVYDGYRPQMAVDEFLDWSKDTSDLCAKDYYYPTLEKKDIIEGGYLAKVTSTHSRGSTFDLTLINAGNKVQAVQYSKRVLKNTDEIFFLDDGTVDMGSSFDLFHEISHHDSPLVGAAEAQVRNLLRESMKRFGFKEHPREWWHYCLENEPYPDTYFNFCLTWVFEQSSCM